MLIIGLDYHPSFQQIAFVDTETGACGEQRLEHPHEAQQFYRELHQRGIGVRMGMEASGHSRWFERLITELGFELLIADPAQVRARRVRKHKTDRQDAELLLRLTMKDELPQIWVPRWENRDLRQLLWHRHRLVQMRTRVVNQLHAVALNEGLQRKKSLWRSSGRTELESLVLAPWANRRRQDLLVLLDQLEPAIAELTRAVEQEAQKQPEALLLMTHPGVGAITALAFVLIIGDPRRFPNGKKLSSYLGLVPARATAARSHQQTGELAIAVPAGGSSPGSGAERSSVAASFSAPGPAPRASHREGGDGAQAGREFVVDVAQREARFARGTAWNSPWCRLALALMIRRPAPRGVRRSNHDRGCDRRDGWVGLSSIRQIRSEPQVGMATALIDRNGALC